MRKTRAPLCVYYAIGAWWESAADQRVLVHVTRARPLCRYVCISCPLLALGLIIIQLHSNRHRSPVGAVHCGAGGSWELKHDEGLAYLGPG